MKNNFQTLKMLHCCSVGIGLLAVVGGFCEGRPPDPAGNRYEFTQIQMGIPFKVVVYSRDEAAANKAAQAAFRRVEQLNKVLSDYDPASELSTLSRMSPTAQPVPVSDPLWRVLERSEQLACQSDGAFDVTVGPLVRLWRRARRTKELPSPERLREARAAVGYRHLLLDSKTRGVRLRKRGMKLDLGGIGVGYAVDEALKVLAAHGQNMAMIDASGDIGVIGTPPGTRGWRIAIQPYAQELVVREAQKFLRLTGGAVTTSGDALQHVDIGGKRYSHIIDPRSGYALTNRIAVTIVARDCTTADSLATAVSVLGPEKGIALVDGTAGAAGLIAQIEEDESIKTFPSRDWRKMPLETSAALEPRQSTPRERFDMLGNGAPQVAPGGAARRCTKQAREGRTRVDRSH